MENKVISAKMFLKWLDTYGTGVSYMSTTDGTIFLDIAGWDGGDVGNDGLCDFENVNFSNPKSVDEWYAEIAEEYEGIDSLPEVSFEDFCKSKSEKQIP